MTIQSDRLGLPLLAAAQAQKEVTHNEALALLDAMVQPVVLSVAPATIPTSPLPGQAWIVGASPTAAWAGQAGAIAVWTRGGWRFVDPVEGMFIWSIADRFGFRREAGAGVAGVLTGRTVELEGLQVLGTRRGVIAAPSGGTTIDSQARFAVSEILTAMREHGLIAT